jgi:hypothetical protein
MTFSHIVTTGDFNYPDIDWELWNAKEESSLSFIECVRDRPFNLKGVGGYGFLFRSFVLSYGDQSFDEENCLLGNDHLT